MLDEFTVVREIMIFEKVRKILSDQFDIDENSITYETDFFKDLNADSLDIADLLSTLSGEFEVEFESESLESFHNVKELVDFISDKTDTME